MAPFVKLYPLALLLGSCRVKERTRLYVLTTTERDGDCLIRWITSERDESYSFSPIGNVSIAVIGDWRNHAKKSVRPHSCFVSDLRMRTHVVERVVIKHRLGWDHTHALWHVVHRERC